jgi:GNAT superfamily N-acetyltransferase
MQPKIVPFQPDLLDAAAQLLAARHQRNRLARPELPARFTEAAIARLAVEAAWQRPHASGVATLAGDRLAGYLIGYISVDTLRGRSAWIPLAGHALAEAHPADLYRELYAAAAPAWLAAGCFDHYPLIPATDQAALAAWFSLGFGQEQVYGLRLLTEADLTAESNRADLTLRRATIEDRAILAELSPLIGRHQAQAPIWAPHPPDFQAEVRAGYAGLVDEETVTVWLAIQAGEVVGFQAYFPAEPSNSDMMIPEACLELHIAATRPGWQGQGIGEALTRHSLAEARRSGYACCLIDWRATNLSAARFWPHQGFQPVVYRLARHIDPRIAWAHGNY